MGLLRLPGVGTGPEDAAFARRLCGLFFAGERVDPGPALEPYVQDALDKIDRRRRRDRNGAPGASKTATLTPSPFTMLKSATRTALTNPALTTAATRSSITPSNSVIPTSRSSPPLP